MRLWTGISRRRFALALTLTLLLAAFMRFYQLASLPPGLHPDEAANGLDVFRIFHHDWRPFYPTNGGREALFFYLQSVGVWLFGNTIIGLRVAPALIGVLAVGATYLWISSWFDRRSGLIAAFLMAVTPWAITISRDGFRAGMVALMIPLTLWLFTKAFASRRKLVFVLAGISLGLGFYTYIAYRLFPLALVLMGIFLLIWRRGFIKRWAVHLIIAVISMAVTLVPLGIYSYHHPGEVSGRPSGVSFLNPDLNHGRPVQTLASTVIKTAGMFNIHGDQNYRQNLGGQPEFNIFVGVMFLLGLLVALKRIKRLPYFGLLAVFAVMLLPEVLTAEGIPHALRSIGALPAAVGLASVGITYLLGQWYSVFPFNRAARIGGAVSVFVLLGLTAYQGYVQYFIAWANSPETYKAYAEDSVALASYYLTHAYSGRRYAVASGYQMMPVEYLTHDKTSYQLLDKNQLGKIDTHQAEEFAIFESDKDQVVRQLRTELPKGHLSPHFSSFSGDELFVTYSSDTK